MININFTFIAFSRQFCLQVTFIQFSICYVNDYKHVIILHTGTFAVLSIMVGIVCSNLAPEVKFTHFNETLNATIVDEKSMNEARLALSGTLACLTAIIQVTYIQVLYLVMCV